MTRLIEITVEPDAIVAGAEATIHVSVTNNGDKTCTQIRASLLFPPDLLVVSGLPLVEIPSLPPGGIAKRAFQVEATRAGTCPLAVQYCSYRDPLGQVQRLPTLTLPLLALEKVAEGAVSQDAHAHNPTLPQAPQELRPDQRNTLHQALLAAFDVDSLRMMLSFQMGTSLDVIARSGSRSQAAFEVIVWAERAGRVQELVCSARASVPGNQKLARFAEQFEGRPT